MGRWGVRVSGGAVTKSVKRIGAVVSAAVGLAIASVSASAHARDDGAVFYPSTFEGVLEGGGLTVTYALSHNVDGRSVIEGECRYRDEFREPYQLELPGAVETIEEVFLVRLVHQPHEYGLTSIIQIYSVDAIDYGDTSLDGHLNGRVAVSEVFFWDCEYTGWRVRDMDGRIYHGEEVGD